MRIPRYTWTGDWQGPRHGQYVIEKDGVEMEPGQVCQMLDEYWQVLEQVEQLVTRKIRPEFKIIDNADGTFEY